jgi:hypothetical protein
MQVILKGAPVIPACATTLRSFFITIVCDIHNLENPGLPFVSRLCVATVRLENPRPARFSMRVRCVFLYQKTSLNVHVCSTPFSPNLSGSKLFSLATTNILSCAVQNWPNQNCPQRCRCVATDMQIVPYMRSFWTRQGLGHVAQLTHTYFNLPSWKHAREDFSFQFGTCRSVPEAPETLHLFLWFHIITLFQK